MCGDGLACGGHGERWDDGRGGRASLSWSAQRPSARHFCLPPFKRVARFIFRQASVEHEPIGQTIYYIPNPLSHAPSLARLTLPPSAARLYRVPLLHTSAAGVSCVAPQRLLHLSAAFSRPPDCIFCPDYISLTITLLSLPRPVPFLPPPIPPCTPLSFQTSHHRSTMPFLQTLNDLKDLTNSINPLNFLSPDHQSSPAPSPSTSPARPAAPPNQSEAGPGPSSLASRNAVAVNQRSVYSSPADSPRPSPKHSSSSSLPPSSDSAESVPVPRGAGAANVTGRRKSSGTSVVIAEPEVTNMARGRQKRPPSVASGISGFGDDGFSDRRGKKNPSDVSR